MSLLQERLKAVNNAQNQPISRSLEQNSILIQEKHHNNNISVLQTKNVMEDDLDEEDDILNAIKRKQDNVPIFNDNAVLDRTDINSSINSYKETSNDIRNTFEKSIMSEEMLEAYELKREKEEREQLRKNRIITKVTNIFLSVCCFYIIFLIYGVSVTDYYYNEEGVIVPQILSVNDIKEGKEFEILLVQYEKCRVLYEDVLLLDYRLSQGVEEPIVIAPEYEALLDEVENIIVQIEALDTETRYEQVKNMLLTWVKTDLAIYLQKMSSAISQNNSEDASIAMTYKIIVYNDFSLITENMVIMGDNINGIDMTDIKNWSPEKYIDEKINGNK